MGKQEERRAGVGEPEPPSKKSNFNLLGFIKSLRENTSKALDREVVAPMLPAPEPVRPTDLSPDHSSGDEKLSKAFGVNLSYTRTPRVNSEQNTDSIELENPEIERSMLTDELRTLKFCLNDEDEESDRRNLFNSQTVEVQRESVSYSAPRRSFMNETSLNRGSVIVIKNRNERGQFANSDSQREVYGPHHNDKNPIYFKDLNETKMGGLSTVHEQGDINSVNYHVNQDMQYCYNDNYNMFDPDEDQVFHRDAHNVQSFYMSHYAPNVDLSLIKGVRHPNMTYGYYPPYPLDQSSDNKKQKKGKRSFWKVEDTSEYDILIDQIYREMKTTLMVRNIPNKYTKELLLDTIDEYFKDAYDFLYLPIDFKNNCNVGYAFINFKELKSIEPFYKRFNKKKWAIFNSEKICVIKYARIQGKEECERHFRDSSLMKQPVR